MVLETRYLADEYAAASEGMEALRDGHALRSAAAAVARRLPPGRLALLSTSPEGAALAAVCASTRSAPTSWQLIHLAYPPRVHPDAHVVVVEPVDPGCGWEAAVRRHYGDAVLLFVDDAAELPAQAA